MLCALESVEMAAKSWEKNYLQINSRLAGKFRKTKSRKIVNFYLFNWFHRISLNTILKPFCLGSMDSQFHDKKLIAKH